MQTGQSGQVKQASLLEEVLKTRELATALRDRMRDVFVKEKRGAPSESEGLPTNPIDYAIAISQLTQNTLRICLELLEVEIISKLVGE